MKKKAKKKSGKKATKQSKKVNGNQELDPAQVLKSIAAMIKEEAPEIAKAVIGEGKKGQLSPAKYLFEMAHIFPQGDATTPTEREESLAETLLDRLNIPKTPVVHDELQKDDEDVMVMQPVKQAEESSEEGKEEAEAAQ